MTKKRNLLLVSLFLVFGLMAMASSAMAQVAFNVSQNTNQFGRPEGLTEYAGAVTLTSQGSGTVTAKSYFTVTYTASISGPNSVYLYCVGAFSTGTLGVCNASVGAPTLVGTTAVKIPITGSGIVFGATGTSTISVYVRINANKHGPGNVYDSVTASFYSGSNASIGTQGTNPVLEIQGYPSLSVGFGYFFQYQSQIADVLICLGVIKHNTEYENHFVINVDEEFELALTTSVWEYAEDPGAPGSVTNDTFITVTLNNIPKGFGIVAEYPIPCWVTTSNPLYCSGGSLAAAQPSPDWFEGDGVTTSVTFQYDVTSTDAGSPENINLPFKFWSDGPLGTGGLPDITAQVKLDPNPTDDPACSSCIPMFAYHLEGSPQPAGVTLDVVEFNNCLTNLLWPFITFGGGWDSAISVANTSMDQLGSSTDALLAAGAAVPQNGTCSYSFYSGGSLQAEWTDAAPIVAGSTQGYDMSATLATVAPTFGGGNGYVFATCMFANAKGYAYVSNSWGASNAVFGNYLAEIIPDPEWIHRSTNGDGLGEGAPTPLNINRRILKEFFYGYGADPKK